MFGKVLHFTLAAVLLVSLAYARKREQPAGTFTIDVDYPYAKVVDVVKAVVNSGVILGTFEYKDTQELPDAEAPQSCPIFKPWAGGGEVFCKVRRKALSPAHFIGSNDIGTVAVRYVVQSLTPASTRIFIDATFMEDARHSEHVSDGSVETSEFGVIQQRLRGEPGAAGEASTSQPSPPQQPVGNSAGPAALEKDSANVAITAQQSELKAAPYSSAAPLRTLKKGDRITVVRRGQYWYQVRVADGMVGWLHHSALEASLAAVKPGGANVMSQKGATGAVLFRARAEDEFEVIGREDDWIQVRLDGNSTGWIPRNDLTLADDSPEVSSPPAKVADVADLGFWVSREQVNEFSGEWSQLQGKKALFVFAQPRGVLPEVANDNRKLAFAKSIFADRYRTASLTQNPFDGVVVIFVGGRGGVAAATMQDIKQWVLGSLSEDAFVSRCSLDPAGEFQARQQ